MKLLTHSISKEAGLRLDVCISAVFPELTRSAAQRLIAEGAVLVDGKHQKSNYRLKAGQQIEVRVPDPVPTDNLAEDIPLNVVYEDSDIIVIDKSAGMVVHPAAGNRSGTLVNALLYHVDDLAGVGGEERPGIVHRLDKDTSGLLVVAKNDKSLLFLQHQLATRTMGREYLAIVHGRFKQEAGTISAPIGRHPTRRKEMAVVSDGRPAITHYQVLEDYHLYTLLSCKLDTGRTHQIRVHMSHIGHPVVGDTVYGPRKAPFDLSRQMLHARKLTLLHPTTKETMEFLSEVPFAIAELIQRLRKKR